MKNRATCLFATLALLGTATACGTNGKAITSSDTITAGRGACTASPQQVKQSEGFFKVRNIGSTATSVAIYTENQRGHFTKLMGRARAVSPGGSARIKTALPQGQYRVVCSPSGGRASSTYVRAVTIEEGGGGPERAYDVEYQFQVTPGGSVSAPPNMSAGAGDDVKFEVFNHSGRDYRLVVTGPSGQVGALVAPARQLGQTNAVPETPGHLQVKVYAPGQRPATFPLTVRPS